VLLRQQLAVGASWLDGLHDDIQPAKKH
jgi:hypothetical protein